MTLKRGFGVWTAAALLIGQVIAVGIFLTPAGMAKAVGSPFWLFAIWLVTGAMTLSGALCYGELAARYPEAGGSYVYLREIWGRPCAFLYGWMCLLVLDPGLTATLAVGLAKYLAYLAPLTPGGQAAAAIGVVCALGLLNIRGARLGAGFLRAMTLLKIGTLLFVIVYGFAGGAGDWHNFAPFFAAPPDAFGALAGGLVGAFFAFAGWWEVTRIAGEVAEPQRNLPRALVAGILVVTLLYVATSAAFLYLVPVAGVASDETFAAQAGEALFGRTGGALFAAVVVVSILGSLAAYLMASPRLYYAMARDGLFFESFGAPHARFGTPHRATLVQMALAAGLILAGTFEQIIAYFFFVVVLFVALAVAGVFRVHGAPFAGYRTALYPLTPAFFLLVTAAVLVLIALRSPLQSFAGVGVALLGLPVYYLYFVGGNRKYGVDQNDSV